MTSRILAFLLGIILTLFTIGAAALGLLRRKW